MHSFCLFTFCNSFISISLSLLTFSSLLDFFYTTFLSGLFSKQFFFSVLDYAAASFAFLVLCFPTVFFNSPNNSLVRDLNMCLNFEFLWTFMVCVAVSQNVVFFMLLNSWKNWALLFLFCFPSLYFFKEKLNFGEK